MKRVMAWIAWCYVAVGVIGFLVYPIAGEAVRSVFSIVAIAALLPAAFLARRYHNFPRSLIAVVGLIGVLYVTSAILTTTSSGPLAGAVESVLDLVANALIIGVYAYVLSKRRGRITTGDVVVYVPPVVIVPAGGLYCWVIVGAIEAAPVLHDEHGDGRATVCGHVLHGELGIVVVNVTGTW